MYKHTHNFSIHFSYTQKIIIVSPSPESSETVPVSRRLHWPLRVIGHSYTNPVFLVWEFDKVPFGAPTMMLREKREEGREGGKEGGRERVGKGGGVREGRCAVPIN